VSALDSSEGDRLQLALPASPPYIHGHTQHYHALLNIHLDQHIHSRNLHVTYSKIHFTSNIFFIHDLKIEMYVSMYRAFNAVFRKVGRIASPDVQLVKTRCLPIILCYGIEVCPANKSDIISLVVDNR